MIRGVALWALALLSLLGCVWTHSAAAQLDGASWSAPRGCPSALQVAAELDVLLANSSERVRPMRIRARVQKQRGGGYTLTLMLHSSDYHAERHLRSARCEGVVKAAVWLMALALDPGLRVEAPPLAASSSQTPAPAAEPSPPPVESPRSPAPSSASQVPPATVKLERLPGRPELSALWWRAGLFTGVSHAGLPSAQATLGARAGLGLGVLYAELRAASEFARTRELREDTSVRISTAHLGVALCSQWGQLARFGPCATFSVLRTLGDAQGTEESPQRALLWAATGLSLQLGWRLGAWLEPMLEAGIQLPVTARPRFTIDGLDDVVRANPITLYARLGVGYRSRALERGR